ncbi:MAG: L,D-transpeptidase [Candidatus Levybacteria bacterium]|nr:L,D-transpeptidase [Candidatus Levybacteria bacterium]MBP9815061.1 L,D-transpeptidase [Candidatus Levybacteria bacterium]
MSKKTLHKKTIHRSKKKILRTKKVIVLFLGGALVLLLGVLSLTFITQEKFCANSISCITDLSGKYEDHAKTGVFSGKTIKVPVQVALAYTNPSKNVLGETSGKKKIKVDLSSQRLYAYEGDQMIMDFPVSTGKWNKTPTGIFNIWVKLLYTRMAGGSGADYYNLPNVPYTMFYSNAEVPRGAGYSIHGAYWHNNFGHPMSHGCVNMRIADAGLLFAWADPQTTGWNSKTTEVNQGTEVEVYGETPVE